MPVLQDIVQITADNTNVFNARFGAVLKPWTRRVRLQVIASDTDWTFSCSLGGEEMARDSGPHVASADNAQGGDWTRPHIMKEVARGLTDFDVLVNVNVVTAGVGLVILQQEA